MSLCNPCNTGSAGAPYPAFPPPVGAGSSSQSSGSSSSSGSPTGTGCPDGTSLPLVSASFTLPSTGGVGQLSSSCASNWAIPGNSLFIPPFGVVSITGVAGDLISYQNDTITPGTTISAGQRLFQFIPADTSAGTVGSALEQVAGFLGGVSTLLTGSPFQLLRWNQQGSNTYLQNIAGYQLYYPLATPTLITDVSDANLTNPIASGVSSVTATYNLPGLPAPLPPSFGIQLSVELQNPTNETSYANGFRVTRSGAEIARCHYEGTTTWPVVRTTTNQLQLGFTKVAARNSCVARVYVHGYFI